MKKMSATIVSKLHYLFGLQFTSSYYQISDELGAHGKHRKKLRKPHLFSIKVMFLFRKYILGRVKHIFLSLASSHSLILYMP